jgi:hypothetical protein
VKSSSVAIGVGLAKIAAAHPLSLSGTARAAAGIGSALGGVVNFGGHLGRAAAEAVGAPGSLGYLAGAAVPVLGGVHAANQVKRKVDNWRYQNGYYDPSSYGY